MLLLHHKTCYPFIANWCNLTVLNWKSKCLTHSMSGILLSKVIDIDGKLMHANQLCLCYWLLSMWWPVKNTSNMQLLPFLLTRSLLISVLHYIIMSVWIFTHFNTFINMFFYTISDFIMQLKFFQNKLVLTNQYWLNFQIIFLFYIHLSATKLGKCINPPSQALSYGLNSSTCVRKNHCYLQNPC